MTDVKFALRNTPVIRTSVNFGVCLDRPIYMPAKRPTKTLILLLFTVALSACSDGVVVDSANPIASSGAAPGDTPSIQPPSVGPTAPGTTDAGQPAQNPDAGPVTPAQAPDTSDFNAGNLSAQDVEAARFLTQATFGPNEESIAEFRQIGSIDAWIDRQVSLPISTCLLYTSPSPRDKRQSRMPSSA